MGMGLPQVGVTGFPGHTIEGRSRGFRWVGVTCGLASHNKSYWVENGVVISGVCAIIQCSTNLSYVATPKHYR